jgi:CDP-diacylglycerol--serine O-phosphatidyltransferase
MKIKQHIPNFITTLNLISGFIAIIQVHHGDLVMASAFIFLAAVFDFLDGNIARLLKAYSEFGKQLDSLADVVSFGVAPGFLVYSILESGCQGSCNILEQLHITPYFALLIPVCSALRLAKFNIDLRQEENFIGLPTPANALFFASIPLVVILQPTLLSLVPVDFLTGFFSNTRIVAILVVFFSYLMISDLRIFSMKVKTLTWQGNQLRFSLIIIAVLLLALFSLAAIPMIIATYLLLSVFFQRSI